MLSALYNPWILSLYSPKLGCCCHFLTRCIKIQKWIITSCASTDFCYETTVVMGGITPDTVIGHNCKECLLRQRMNASVRNVRPPGHQVWDESQSWQQGMETLRYCTCRAVSPLGNGDTTLTCLFGWGLEHVGLNSTSATKTTCQPTATRSGMLQDLFFEINK